MSEQVIQSAATEALVNVALAVVTILAAIAAHYIRLAASKIKAQTARIEDEAGREALENALDDVERLAALAVNCTEQTAAKDLREAVRAGTAGRDQLMALGRAVRDDVKREIAPEVQKIITDNLGSFDCYLMKCVEAAVLKVKQTDALVAVTVNDECAAVEAPSQSQGG